jgi:hypothetical protein
MLILRLARKLASHVDPEANLQCTLQVLKANLFETKGVSFYEVLGLPLSGGYVGIRLVPNFSLLNRTVAGLNRAVSACVTAARLGPQLCWRYIVHADVKS